MHDLVLAARHPDRLEAAAAEVRALAQEGLGKKSTLCHAVPGVMKPIFRRVMGMEEQ